MKVGTIGCGGVERAGQHAIGAAHDARGSFQALGLGPLVHASDVFLLTLPFEGPRAQ